MDHSPPKPGAFAIETTHAAALQRHRDGAMTYTNANQSASLKVSWVGFVDPHSKIHMHHTTVGTTYSGTDMAGVGKL